MSKHPKLQAFNLSQWLDTNRERLVPPVNNQLLHDDSTGMIVMVIGGPNTRVDFHDDPVDEWFYQIKGDMMLKIADGGEIFDVPIRQGEVFMLPSHTVHAPQRPQKDSIGIVVESHREKGMLEGFEWYCFGCGAKVHRVEVALLRIVFMSILRFSMRAISLLVETMGPERVMLGSDYSSDRGGRFRMGDLDGVGPSTSSFRASVAESSNPALKPFCGHFLDAATARSMTAGGMAGGSMNRFADRAGTRGQIVKPGGGRGAGSRQVTAPRYYARSLNHPILQSQSSHSLKFFYVIGDQNQSFTASMAGNHLVIGANGLSRFGLLSANLSRVRSRFSTVGQDFQARRKPLQDVEVAFWIGGFFSAIRQFHHSNTGDTHLTVVFHESFFHRGRFIFHGVNNNIGIQHVFEHQKDSRS